jgi:Ca-activated chloride channel family protein
MFKFEHPDHFWLLASVPVLSLLWGMWWFWQQRARKRLGEISYILPQIAGRRFVAKNFILLIAMVLLTVAWANPQLGAKQETVTQESSDVFIALDISQSMMCQDVAPSRLELAKIFIQKLVQQLEGERIGLIFFAGNAFLQMPLSSDYAFILQSVQSATPDLLTEQGTDIAAAIDIAQESFDPEPGGGRMLVVISDGETHTDEALDKADEAYDNGTVIYTVGAGTVTGGPIPTGGTGAGEYKRDENNNLVRTRLEEGNLGQIALAGGGNSFNISQGDGAIAALQSAVRGLQKRTHQVRSFAAFESRYQWFLLPALLLLLLEMFIRYQKKS